MRLVVRKPFKFSLLPIDLVILDHAVVISNLNSKFQFALETRSCNHFRQTNKHQQLPIDQWPKVHSPSEVQLPVESTPGHVRRRYVLERFVRDDVDDGTDDRLPVLDDPGEERFEPTFRALAVGVQERDDLALDVLRPQETRPDQTGALLRSQDHHRNGQRLDVLLQLAAQVFCKTCQNFCERNGSFVRTAPATDGRRVLASAGEVGFCRGRLRHVCH